MYNYYGISFYFSERKHIMSNNVFSSISPPCFKMLTYGAFSVVCHLAAISLYFSLHADSLPGALLVRTGTSMIEYSLISIIAILVGALLLQILELENNTD